MTDEHIPEHEHYRVMAAAYDHQVKAILPRHDLFFESCIRIIPPGKISILELGSGTGFATALIRKRCPDALITGIDHAPEMIRCAREKEELKDVSFLEQDIRDPWPENSYQVIISTLCLHHIPRTDRKKLLRKVFTTLTDHGFFICGDIIRSSSPEGEKIYTDHWMKAMIDEGMPHDEMAKIAASRAMNLPEMETVESFTQNLRTAGFSPVMMPYRYEISAVFLGYKGDNQTR